MVHVNQVAPELQKLCDVIKKIEKSVGENKSGSPTKVADFKPEGGVSMDTLMSMMKTKARMNEGALEESPRDAVPEMGSMSAMVQAIMEDFGECGR